MEVSQCFKLKTSPSLTSLFRAPTDCTQYFTGVAGNVQSYSYGQMLSSQYYMNCIRTEAGYCAIQWKQSSTTSPDPFGILGTTPATTVAAAGHSSPTPTLCTNGFIFIPDLSMDGISKIPVPLGLGAFQSEQCGAVFGVESQTTSAALICKPRLEMLVIILLISSSSQTTFCSWSLH